MFIVTLSHNGSTFYLRATVWTAARERASTFETMEAANAQLGKAKQFMKAAQFKAARVVEA